MRIKNLFARGSLKITACLITLGAEAVASESELTVKNDSLYQTIVRENSFKSNHKIVIDEKMIQESKASTVTELLQTKANIFVSNTSFQPQFLYLRGGDPSHILILIDGVPVYDPGTAQRALNLNSINLKEVRRIEVLRGAQPVLYGGQALVGVIKIQTFGKKLVPNLNTGIEAGSFEYKQGYLQGSRLIDETKMFRAGVSSSYKENPSPLLASKQIYPQRRVNVDLAYAQQDNQDWIVKLFRAEDSTYLSSATPPSYKTMDTLDLNKSMQFNGATFFWSGKNLSLRPEFSLGSVFSNHRFSQPENSSNSSEFDETYSSQLTHARGTIHALETEKFVWLFGLNYLKESFVFRDLVQERANSFGEQRGVFTKLDYNFTDDMAAEAGARIDSSTNLSSEWSSQFGLTLYQDTKLEYATAFRTPSQFQYYGRYGNALLRSEKSESISVSHDFRISSMQFLSFSLFQLNFSDLIATRGNPPRYHNISRAQIQGVDMMYSANVWDHSKFSAQYTYQEPYDVDNKTWLLRRPLNLANMNWTTKWNQQIFGAEVLYRGERTAQTGSRSTKALAAATTSNIFWSQTWASGWEGSIRLNNLTDERFEESYNYFNEGRFLSLGLNYNFL